MIVSPLLMGRIAYTPRPCTPDSRTWMRRPASASPLRWEGAVVVGLEVALDGRVLGLGSFIGYIEIRRARVCVRAREDWRDCRHARQRQSRANGRNSERDPNEPWRSH